VLRRLVSSRTNRPPLSLSKIVKLLKGQDKTVVFVGTVTDDIRLLDVPKVTVAALKFTETARARVTKAGGKCMTLDELVMKAPTGSNTLLLRATKDREAKKHFGAAPGLPGSRTKPFIRHKGRKFERCKAL
jgi:large subunit ribosomal protein L18e